jgi:methylglutaconyl-CoA hydratase
MAHDTVRLTRQGAVTRVALDRPDVRNAFNDEMLVDLVEAFTAIRDDPEVRVAVLTGEGSCFCAGADVNWMKRVVDYTQQENYEDSLRLALMLHEIYSCPKPVIARINGPAAISPYLLKRMGERNLKEYTLTGERFKAPRAAELGLINAVAPANGLDAAVEAKIEKILTGGPEALAAAKLLIRGIGERSLEANGPYTAELITQRRMSAEGQEGMNAFLQKAKPRWVVDAEESAAR